MLSHFLAANRPASRLKCFDSQLRLCQVEIDLLAGASWAANHPTTMRSAMRAPTILVFDSGVGGLSVFAEVAKARPDARFVYAADDAAFPYGRLGEAALVARVRQVVGKLIDAHKPDLVVVACNTASTLVLPALRAHFEVPFVGTVPAIKMAAERSTSGVFAVLATPGTVARDYTQDLIRRYAASCDVTLVGSRHLAGLAEAALKGDEVADEAILAEIAPCFVRRGGKRTDSVVLACTHYPLLIERYRALAPWPVTWIDPAPAIARRVTQLIGEVPAIWRCQDDNIAVFTSGESVTPALHAALEGRGLAGLRIEPMPLSVAAQVAPHAHPPA